MTTFAYRNKGPNRLYSGMIAAVLLCIAAAVSAQPAPETVTVITFGDSPIKNDVAGAKNAAIAESIRLAVQTAATGFLSVPELTDNFEAVSNLFSAKPNEFVQGYKVLKELRAAGSYHVLLETTVMAGRLRAEIVTKESPRTVSGNFPKVVVMIAEKRISDIDFQYWWAKGHLLSAPDTASQPIVAILREKGIPVISPEEAGKHTEELYIGLEMAAIPPDFEAAMFGKRLGADLVVVGTAIVEPSLNRMDGDVRTVKGSVEIRVLLAETGENLDAIKEDVVNFGPDTEIVAQKAFSDASKKAGEQLADKIVSLGGKDASSPGAVILLVTGRNILPQLEKFRRAVMTTPGVSTLQIDHMTPDSATLSVSFKGTPQELADKLMLQAYDKFGINISDITSRELTIELIPR